MKHVYYSFLILIILTLFLTLYGIYMGGELTDLRVLLHKEDPDNEAVLTKWQNLSLALELTVIRSDYETAREEMMLFISGEGNRSNARDPTERLDRALAKIQEGFIPSFTGVF